MNAKQIDYDLDIREHQDAYDEMLNECYGPVYIGNLTFEPADILRELDPTAYRCDFNDYTDGLPEIWECGECGDEFDDELHAELCCRPDPPCEGCKHSGPEKCDNYCDSFYSDFQPKERN